MPCLKYEANPTLARFHQSDAFVRGVMGPYRSGKSVGMCLELFRRACMQAPGADGVRHTRWVIVRSTYPELRSTTIATWQNWFPEKVCPIVYSAPITGKMFIPLSDGTKVEMTLWFLALDRPEDASAIGGLEVTGAWINEARDIDNVIINTLCARVGQYPAVKDGGCTWRGVIMDTNPPDDSHWWYRMFEEVHPAGWEMFRQPPAVLRDPKVVGRWHANPDAENLQNLDGGMSYYERLIESSSEEWIKIYLAGEYGATFDGRPVWPEYNDLVHVAKEPLLPIKGVAIQLGWDYGLTPSCVISQLSARGQMLVLAEYAATEIGIRGFITSVVKPALVQHWKGFVIRSMGDPAGSQRSQADERTCFDELNAAGIPTEPAPTNAFAARRECVAGFLSRNVEGLPGFILDPGCKLLRKALNGKYHFERIHTVAKGGEVVFKDAPAKNQYSHVCIVEGEKVETDAGPLAIEFIRPGDMVLTPFGFKKVIASGCTDFVESCVEVRTDRGTRVRCTPSHPFFVHSAGLVRADALAYGSVVQSIKENVVWNALRGSSSTAIRIGFRGIITAGTTGALLGQAICTGRYGSFITALFRKATTCITRTETHSTTTSPTWKWLQSLNTTGATCLRPSGSSSQGAFSTPLGILLPPGTKAPQQSQFSGEPEWLRGRIDKASASSALYAVRSSRLVFLLGHTFAAERVLRRGVGVLARTMRSAVVLLVEWSLRLAGIRRPERVQSVVPVSFFPSRVAVYNLTVEEGHCFFVNGLLVSNCDALQYAALALDPVLNVKRRVAPITPRGITAKGWA